MRCTAEIVDVNGIVYHCRYQATHGGDHQAWLDDDFEALGPAVYWSGYAQGRVTCVGG